MKVLLDKNLENYKPTKNFKLGIWLQTFFRCLLEGVFYATFL